MKERLSRRQIAFDLGEDTLLPRGQEHDPPTPLSLIGNRSGTVSGHGPRLGGGPIILISRNINRVLALE